MNWIIRKMMHIHGLSRLVIRCLILVLCVCVCVCVCVFVTLIVSCGRHRWLPVISGSWMSSTSLFIALSFVPCLSDRCWISPVLLPVILCVPLSESSCRAVPVPVPFGLLTWCFPFTLDTLHTVFTLLFRTAHRSPCVTTLLLAATCWTLWFSQ